MCLRRVRYGAAPQGSMMTEVPNMAVEKMEFRAGTVLVARYKKQAYRLTVVATEQGVRFRLEDGREFKSLSAAGSHLMGGKAVNGWRFWTLEGEDYPAGAGTPGTSQKQPRKVGASLIYEMKNQENVPARRRRWWCSACCDGFLVPAGVTPQGCAKGHPADGAGLMQGESAASEGEAPGDECTEAQEVETTMEELTREPIDYPEDNAAF